MPYSPATFDLCTLADVQAYLGAAVAGDASRIQKMITSCSRYVQSQIGYNIAQANYTETYDGHDGPKRFVQVRPVVSVQSVSIDGRAISPCQTATDTGYVVQRWGVELRGGWPYVFCRGVGNVVIAYTAGYATPPEDLNQLVCEVVGSKLKRTARIGLVSENTGKETTSFAREDFTQEHKAIISQYQLPAIA